MYQRRLKEVKTEGVRKRMFNTDHSRQKVNEVHWSVTSKQNLVGYPQAYVSI